MEADIFASTKNSRHFENLQVDLKKHQEVAKTRFARRWWAIRCQFAEKLGTGRRWRPAAARQEALRPWSLAPGQVTAARSGRQSVSMSGDRALACLWLMQGQALRLGLIFDTRVAV